VNAASPDDRRLVLQHGHVVHGLQFTSENKRHLPTYRYGPTSGVGLVFNHVFPEDAPRRIGVIGLGAATLAAYGRTADTFRFYESDWMILTPYPQRLDVPQIQKAARPLPPEFDNFPIWTDNYASLARIIK